MRLDRTTDLVALNIDELDFTVRATHGDLLASLVELTDVCDRITCVQIGHFLDHTDVPDLDDTVRVA